jgi:hypothetical protein
MRYETICSNCGSDKIMRKDDSKWLFSVRDEKELNQYLQMDRIFLLLMDYPNFDKNDFKDIRISSYEIYPKDNRMKEFGNLLKNHYYNIFKPKQEAKQHTNPMNFHPFSYQFYKCNPILTFSCTIHNIDTTPKIIIDQKNYVEPNIERTKLLPSLRMPTALLKEQEWKELLQKYDYKKLQGQMINKPIDKIEFETKNIKDKTKILPFLDENSREVLSMREIVSVRQKKQYQR